VAEALPPIRIRMYRQGLGDCFLLTLPRRGGAPCHLLLDCGVLLDTPDAEATMTRLARDIVQATGGVLDVVVVTHEHWDHVSGFLQARDVFDGVTIGEVWLPWTEDPADALAASLRQERSRALRGLRTSANRLAGLNPAAGEPLLGLLRLAGAASGPSAREAIDYLAGHGSRPRIRYLRAGGAPLELPGGGDRRVYILGPERAGPSSTATTKAGALRTFSPGLALFAAAGGLSPRDNHLAELSQAFETRYRLPAERAEALPFFREHYHRADDHWRRIDNDWLGTSEQFTLALDNHINNTSLVLAIELEPAGRVLLFPGDAQAETWVSWHGDPSGPAAAPARPVTVADLLSRTIVYKVSHHGSHDATSLSWGLDLMTSAQLAALLPVCRDAAKRLGWNLPFPSLLDELRRKTRGRLIRADEGMPDRPEEIGEAEWAAFARDVAVSPDSLFIDYLI
jgi:hypothetical protein